MGEHDDRGKGLLVRQVPHPHLAADSKRATRNCWGHNSEALQDKDDSILNPETLQVEDGCVRDPEALKSEDSWVRSQEFENLQVDDGWVRHPEKVKKNTIGFGDLFKLKSVGCVRARNGYNNSTYIILFMGGG